MAEDIFDEVARRKKEKGLTSVTAESAKQTLDNFETSTADIAEYASGSSYTSKEEKEKYVSKIQQAKKDLDAASYYYTKYGTDKEKITAISNYYDYLDELETGINNRGKQYSEWDTEEDYKEYTARQNKENDLIGAKDYAKLNADKIKEQERLEYLNIKEARDKKYALEQELDALRKESEGTVSTVSSALNPRKNAQATKSDNTEKIKALQQEVDALNKDIILADRLQTQKYLSESALNSDDFEKYSFEPIIEDEDAEKGYRIYKAANQGREEETIKGYMKDEEKAIYNYYYNKIGEAKAEEYLDSIRETLNKRQAQAMYAGNENNTLAQLAIMAPTQGLEQAKSGFQGALRMVFMGDDSYQPVGTYDYLGQMAREDLADNGFKLPEWLGGSSLGQVAFDFVSTGANMAPSIALGALTGTGPVAFGVSAAGNAYTEAINEGFSKDQATAYGILNGVSEATLEKVVGSIGFGGKTLATKAFEKALPKINNAFTRIAYNYGTKALSEGSEEALQEYLAPIYRNIAFNENNAAEINEEVLYSGLLGALSGVGMAGPSYAINEVKAAIKDYKTKKAEDVETPAKTEPSAEPVEGTEKIASTTFIPKEENSSTVEEDLKNLAKETVEEKAKEISEKEPTVSATSKAGRYVQTISDKSLEEYGSKLPNATEDTGKQVAAMYDPADGISKEAFAKGIDEAYKYGTFNYPIREMDSDSVFAKAIPSGKRHQAYYMGQRNAETANITKANEQQKKALSGVKGKVVFEGNAATQIKNNQQRSTIRFINSVLKNASSMEYHIFASYEEDGKRVYKNSEGKVVPAPNGFYDPKNHQIWIDVNAGAKGQGIMLYTLTHEHVHDIKVWSAERYNELVKITSQAFEHTGKSFKEAVDAKYAQYRKSHPDTTYEDAQEEVVAEAMSGLLSDEKGLREFSEQIQKQDKSLWNRIKAWFNDVIARITAAYKGVAPESEEAKLFMEQKELFEHAQKVFAEAVVTAGENYKNASAQSSTSQVKNVDANAKFQARNSDVSQQNQEKDSEGNILSAEQIEFFKDSKVRDENGKLLVMYHGTPNAGFTKFRSGTYFTQNKKYAEVYKNQGASSLSYKRTADNPDVYAVYLNIKKPFDTRKPKEHHIFIQEFYGQWGNGAPLANSGLPDWVDGMDLQEFIEEKGYDYDGLILDEGATGGYGEEVKSRGLSYVVFSPEQVKNLDNKTPTTDPDIRYQDRDYSYEGNKAVMSKARIDYLIEDSGAGSRKDYAQAWITSINPTDYLNLTTDEKSQNREVFDKFGSEWDPNVNMGNYDYLGQLGKTVRQTPYLAIDINTGEVVGHDGRHRIRALEKEGIKSVEIKVEFREDGRLVKYEPNGERWETLNGIRLTNQFGTGQKALIENVIPLNEDHRAEIEASYGEMSAKGTNIKYSDRDWKPDLDKDEWRIVNYVVDNHQGNELTEKTDYFYRNYKGKKLFGIYSTDNDTLLYAVHEDNADKAYNYLKQYREEYRNGNESFTRTEESDPRLKSIWLQRNARNGNNGSFRQSRKSGSNAPLHGGESGIYAEAALRNVIENIFNEFSGDAEINYQDRLSTADKNRVTILENKIERLEKELKEIESKAVLAGQMSQGKAMAKDLRRKTEAYENAIAKKKEQISAVRQQKNELLAKAKAERAEAVERVRKADRERMEKTIADIKATEKARFKETFEKYKERENAIRKEYQESKKKATEGRHRTAKRAKIKLIVNELNQLLLNPTKERHVPEHMRAMVARALNAIDLYNPKYYETRIENLQNKIVEENDPAIRAELKIKINHYKELEEQAAFKVSEIKEAYETIDKSEDPVVKAGFDTVVAQRIDRVAEEIGNTSFADMSDAQLDAVYDLFKMIKAAINNTNKAFTIARNESISEMGEQAVSDFGAQEKKNKLSPAAVQAFESGVYWNNLKPYYFFRKLGSKVFEDLFGAVRKGEDTWAVDIDEASSFSESIKEKYHYDKWYNQKNPKEFESSAGKKFKLTVPQMMSIYAYSKRKDADKHLSLGGFVFDSLTDIVKKKLGVKITYKVDDATTYNISPETILEIANALTEEQRGFVDEMQKYLSEVMGAKGNEVSMAMYDIKLFKEKYYFPLKSAKQYNAEVEQKNQTADQIKLKNAGFTKSRVPGAGNPVILSDFMDVWASHVNDMSMYHAFTLPIEDINRVLNYKTSMFPNQKSVRGTLENAFGQGAIKYFDQFIKDINGNAVSDSRESFGKTIIGKFKKAAVAGSLSVAVQQPSSIVRAFAVIDPKYIFGISNLPIIEHKKQWNEIKKYAPIAVIKEMGRFDMGTGVGAVDYIKNEKTLTNWIDNTTGSIPAFLDESTWITIWHMVKRETKAKHKDLKINSEEFLNLCGERLTEVVVRTQVYDSTLSRSANMRSKTIYMNALTSFMAESTTSLNMWEDAFNRKDAGAKYKAKIATSLIVSSLFNSALAAFVYALRDDDEDESYWEKYVQSFVSKSLDALNPLTYFPILRDIWSAMQGYDIERIDMSLFVKAIEALNKLSSLIAKDTGDMTKEELEKHKKAIFDSAVDSFGTVLDLFGLPVKNLVRDSKAIAKLAKYVSKGDEFETTIYTVKKAAEEGFANTVPKLILNVVGYKKDDKYKMLYDAIKEGETEYVNRLKSGYKDEKAYHSAVRSALRENDPRIKEAAEARIKGNTSEYMRLAKEIKADGFNQDDIVAAINNEVTEMTKEKDENTSVAKIKGFFKDEDYLNAVLNGNDASDAEIVKQDLIATDIANGKSESAAEKQFYEDFTAEVKEAFENKEISDEEAKKLLKDHGDYTTDEAEDKVEEWSFKEKYGFDYKDRSQAYKDGKISETDLKKAIMEVGDKSAEDADKEIKEIKFKAKYGFAYDDRATAYAEGKITDTELKKVIMEHGGKSEEDADAEVTKIKFKKQYGFNYSDRKNEYIDGNITKEQLKKALIEVDGMTEKNAEWQIEAYDWEKEGFTGVSVAEVKNYNEYCLKAGVSKKDYLYIKEFSDKTTNDKDPITGETIYYSAAKRVAKEINNLDITASQKTAIAKSLGWGSKTMKKVVIW